MAKKPVQKKKATSTKSVKAKKKVATAPAAAPKLTGMWKILEQKKMQQKQNEQARNEGRPLHGPAHSFHVHERDPRSVKFAGPRRKAG